jgi:glutaredoxin-related protein
MNKHKVVLFMKGNPSAPKCGFSRQTVGLLREKGVEFAWFDILSDEDVRQGLKRVNDWPSESGPYTSGTSADAKPSRRSLSMESLSVDSTSSRR